MDEPLVILQLRLTQAEIGSLLMAQLAQVRHHRAQYGEHDPITRVDSAALEKLVAAQRRAGDMR